MPKWNMIDRRKYNLADKNMQKLNERMQWVWFILVIIVIIFLLYSIISGKAQKAVKRAFFPQWYWQGRVAKIEEDIKSNEKLLEYNQLELAKETLIMPFKIQQGEIFGVKQDVSTEQYQNEIDAMQNLIDLIQRRIDKLYEDLERARRQLKKISNQ